MKKKHPKYYEYLEKWKKAPDITHIEQINGWDIKITKKKKDNTLYIINIEGNTIEEILNKIKEKL